MRVSHAQCVRVDMSAIMKAHGEVKVSPIEGYLYFRVTVYKIVVHKLSLLEECPFSNINCPY